MLHTMTSIKVTGKCFNGERLDIFKDGDTRFAIIYGENGSGKSTIAEAINNRKIILSNLPDGELIKAQIFAGYEEIEDFENIYVFNESFIDKNIKHSYRDGLEPFYWFGPEAKSYYDLKGVFYNHVSENRSADSGIVSTFIWINNFFSSLETYFIQVRTQKGIDNREIMEQIIEYHSKFYGFKEKFEKYYMESAKHLLLDDIEISAGVEADIKSFRLFFKELRDCINNFKEDLESQYFQIATNAREEFGKAPSYHYPPHKEEKIYDPLTSIRNLDSAIETINEQLNNKEKSIKNIRRLAGELKKVDPKEPEKISADLINKYLKIIFSGNNLKVESLEHEHCYRIKREEQSIKPSYLSTGEKNIVALCYFFTEITKDFAKDNSLKEDCLIILDDPVSSLDEANKFGINHFLRTVFQQVSKNTKSKIIILTHKLDVVNDFRYIFQEINEKCIFLELKNQDLQPLDTNFSVYNELLKQIYEYACEGEKEDLKIGNSIRRILEAYSYFNYNCSLNDFFKDTGIMEKCGDRRNYFETSLYRIVLNHESHSRGHIKSGDYSLNRTNQKEMIKISKDILALLYLLDKSHVIKHLQNNKGEENNIYKKENIINNIESWLSEIS